MYRFAVEMQADAQRKLWSDNEAPTGDDHPKKQKNPLLAWLRRATGYRFNLAATVLSSGRTDPSLKKIELTSARS
jgi:hypothetical protein